MRFGSRAGGGAAALLTLACGALILLVGCVDPAGAERGKPAPRAAAPASPAPAPTTQPASQPAELPAAGQQYPVPPPPFSEGIFPCSGCHADLQPNLTRRELKDEHVAMRLKHGPRERWCFDCHNPTDRDKLRLASGSLVPFAESYRLCGQCHGDKLRDWKVGVHGKRTGEWDGKRRYLLCAHCHDPHAPRFKPVKPMPPPTRPEHLR